MTTSRDTLSKSETVTIAAIEDRVPLLVEAREVIAEFHAMIKRRSQVDLGTWLFVRRLAPSLQGLVVIRRAILALTQFWCV
jgi:hypothetical protein